MAWIKIIIQLIAMAVLVLCIIAIGGAGHWGLALVVMLCAFIVSL
jgi:hypothetical protein